MTADWNVIREYAIPLGASLLAGIVTWSLMLWLFRRMQGRDYRRARIIRVITLPAAFILPLLFLGIATEATPLAGKALAAVQHLLHLGIVGCVTWLLVRAVAAGEAAILRSNPIEVSDNLTARRIQTQTRVLSRVLMGTVILLGISVVLLTFRRCARSARPCWRRPASSGWWPVSRPSRCSAT